MRVAGASLLLLLVTSGAAVATEVTPVVKDQRLGVVVRGIDLPATFPKDLVSGLTNRLLIRLYLMSHLKPVAQMTGEVTVKYDLWSEKFTVSTAVNDEIVSTRICGSIQEVERVLETIRLPGLFPRSEVPTDAASTIRVQMLLNPIDRERLETIRKWVAENSTYTPSDTTTYGGDKRIGNSRSNAIFNKIFEQYSEGKDLAAVWQETASTKPFNLDEVGDE